MLTRSSFILVKLKLHLDEIKLHPDEMMLHLAKMKLDLDEMKLHLNDLIFEFAWIIERLPVRRRASVGQKVSV